MGHHKINMKKTKKKTEQEWGKKKLTNWYEKMKKWREEIGAEIEIYGDLDLESILFSLLCIYILFDCVWNEVSILIWLIMQLIMKRKRIYGMT